VEHILAVLDRSWGLCWRSWAVPGAYVGGLGASWGLSGRSWAEVVGLGRGSGRKSGPNLGGRAFLGMGRFSIFLSGPWVPEIILLQNTHTHTNTRMHACTHAHMRAGRQARTQTNTRVTPLVLLVLAASKIPNKSATHDCPFMVSRQSGHRACKHDSVCIYACR